MAWKQIVCGTEGLITLDGVPLQDGMRVYIRWADGQEKEYNLFHRSEGALSARGSYFVIEHDFDGKHNAVGKSLDIGSGVEMKILEDPPNYSHARLQDALKLARTPTGDSPEKKQWVIDQIVRILLGGKHASSEEIGDHASGHTSTYLYEQWVEDLCSNSGGSKHTWDTGRP